MKEFIMKACLLVMTIVLGVVAGLTAQAAPPASSASSLQKQATASVEKVRCRYDCYSYGYSRYGYGRYGYGRRY
jgi:hypothetical protein